jgi:hypothetical protein
MNFCTYYRTPCIGDRPIIQILNLTTHGFWREIPMNMGVKGAANITKDLIKMGYESFDWIKQAQERLQ